MGAIGKRNGTGNGTVAERLKPAALIEIVGRKRVVVENHRGICYYGDDRILIKVESGYIELTGEAFYLRCVTREHLCITGVIDGVKLIGRSGRDIEK